MDLMQSNDLAEACQRGLQTLVSNGSRSSWRAKLVSLMKRAEEASPEERRSIDFQKVLWNNNDVSAVGRGQINVDLAIEDAGFREFVACLWESSLPQEPEARVAQLKSLYDECLKRLRPWVNRKPLLKVNRVFAAAFPHDFTTVTDFRRLSGLYKAMGGGGSQPHVVNLNRDVLGILAEVLGAPEPDLGSTVERMMLPWILYEDYVQDRGTTATEEVTGLGEGRLIPLPAARRRRGLSAFSGYLETLSAILEFVREGCERDDLREHIRSLNPALKTSSINTTINMMIGEWGAIRTRGDRLELTERAEAFLASEDPVEFSDWLLTRVLGVDNVLWQLREHGGQSNTELLDLLTKVNPGWTTNFAPSVLLRWLREFELIEQGANRKYQLTEEGARWASWIEWTPEKLAPVDKPDVGSGADAPPVITDEPVQIPELDKVLTVVTRHGEFERRLVTRLHYGLWSRSRRHFAVLAGLSGAGKTLMARAYGAAMAPQPDKPEPHLLTVPVQPGWYDPTALLGYINPLSSDSYQRTVFLDFLLSAAQDPARVYTVVLDEMNLSHPEQYLAPLLSAMETGAEINLHSQGTDLDGVPQAVPYPENLVLIGTVNMDETTHALSDKVLDRAFIMEFWDVDVSACPAWREVELSPARKEQVLTLLQSLMQALRPVRLHFGWRLIEDILGFLDACERGGGMDMTAALDSVIYAKILPKLRGEETSRLQQAFQEVHATLAEHNLMESAAKVAQLQDDLKETGSARFWR